MEKSNEEIAKEIAEWAISEELNTVRKRLEKMIITALSDAEARGRLNAEKKFEGNKYAANPIDWFCTNCKPIAQELVRQNRNNVLEEAAKIAETLDWEIKWRGEPHTKTKAGINGQDIAKAIREAKGEK